MSKAITLIAPYKELADLSKTVCDDLDIKAKVLIGDLDEGVCLAKKAVADGGEVIISRGGTATAIANEVDIPVIEIEVGGFDLVRAVGNAKMFGKKIGVVGFNNIVYGAKSLEKILEVEITEVVVSSAKEVPLAIAKAMDFGIEVIIGDAVSVRWGEELGLWTVLVASGKEAIASALRNAKDAALIRKKERIRAEQFKTILDFTYEGIVATDQEGLVSLVNPSAEKMLNVNGRRIQGHPAEEVLPILRLKQVQQTGSPELGKLSRVGDTLVVQNIIPVGMDGEISGVVATFQDANYLQSVETKVRQELHLKGHVAKHTFNDIPTKNPHMEKVIVEARRFAKYDSTILITGETGSGKELFAQSIHNGSARKNGLFVAVNCAAIPENLLESELFGYEEGAFTGARKKGKKGYFELAHGGTLFLDEIGEIPLKLQAHLLRAIQEKAILRVGGDNVIPTDVRIIAATHRNMEDAVEQGNFRRDLYYRLNVLRLRLPTLSERKEDIPMLVESLIERISMKTGCHPISLNDGAMEIFKEYPWKGNIRELENVLERLVIIRNGLAIKREDIEELIPELIPKGHGVRDDLMEEIQLTGSFEEMEKTIICHVLEKNNYDKEKTCKILNISPTTLWRRLKKWGISN